MKNLTMFLLLAIMLSGCAFITSDTAGPCTYHAEYVANYFHKAFDKPTVVVTGDCVYAPGKHAQAYEAPESYHGQGIVPASMVPSSGWYPLQMQGNFPVRGHAEVYPEFVYNVEIFKQARDNGKFNEGYTHSTILENLDMLPISGN